MCDCDNLTVVREVRLGRRQSVRVHLQDLTVVREVRLVSTRDKATPRTCAMSGASYNQLTGF